MKRFEEIEYLIAGETLRELWDISKRINNRLILSTATRRLLAKRMQVLLCKTEFNWNAK